MKKDAEDQYKFMNSDFIATPANVGEWIESAKTKFATHIIIVTDTFDYEDYPVFVSRHQDLRTVIGETNDKPMQRVTSVYEIKKGQATRIEHWKGGEIDRLKEELDDARNKIRRLEAQLKANNG